MQSMVRPFKCSPFKNTNLIKIAGIKIKYSDLKDTYKAILLSLLEDTNGG